MKAIAAQNSQRYQQKKLRVNKSQTPATANPSVSNIDAIADHAPSSALNALEAKPVLIGQLLPIAEIVINPVYQSRVVISQKTVLEYCDALQRGEIFPAVEIIRDRDTGQNILVDGFHRIAAYKKLKREFVQVSYSFGDHAAAITRCVSANTKHGLHRTNADKEKAISMFLQIAEHVNLANRAIAAKLNVSDKTIARVRSQLELDKCIPRVTVRTTQTGRIQGSPARSGHAATIEEDRLTGEIPSQPSDNLKHDGSGVFALLRAVSREKFQIETNWVGDSFCVRIHSSKGLVGFDRLDLNAQNPDKQLFEALRKLLARQ
jgi:hypothetical protein